MIQNILSGFETIINDSRGWNPAVNKIIRKEYIDCESATTDTFFALDNCSYLSFGENGECYIERIIEKINQKQNKSLGKQIGVTQERIELSDESHQYMILRFYGDKNKLDKLGCAIVRVWHNGLN